MKFWFDRNIAVNIAHILRAFDKQHEVVHQDDDPRFARTDADTFIIPTVAAEYPRPVFITADISMYARVPLERKALAASGMSIVFFKKGFHSLEYHTQAVKILTVWPKIVEVVADAHVPTAFELTAAMRKPEVICKTCELDN
jgi:hypothetical protein